MPPLPIPTIHNHSCSFCILSKTPSALVNNISLNIISLNLNGSKWRISQEFCFLSLCLQKASLDPYLAFLFLEVLGLCARISTSYLLYKRLDLASLSYFSLYEQIILYFGFQNLQESQKWTMQGDGLMCQKSGIPIASAAIKSVPSTFSFLPSQLF